MDTAKKIRASLKKLYGKIKSGKEISEEELRSEFVNCGILEALGYEGVPKDIRLEKGIRGKRSDLTAFDDYQNVVFVVEFKKPGGIDLGQDFAQLWERYVKPLRAKYGLLIDGFELLIYERKNGNPERKLRVNLGEITLSQCEEIYDWLKKPKLEIAEVNEVLGYFERFDKPDEKIKLSEEAEIAQKHFFECFELKEGSIFVNLVQATIGLFDFELERSKFLKSAYNFWKISYAKKPEKVPENWRRIMNEIGLEANEENLLKFMFCLESAYSLFTRLILAKACEDYKLPYVEFSRFIKTRIENIGYSYRGTVPLLAWAITTKNLIENMKENLVKSVFEGDIFYWWEDGYEGLKLDALYSPKLGKPKARFSEALADIILTVYKFDFSGIVGDPLGTLYQRYFDKETRKALGEFYTPQEVVEYILDAVGYEGRGVIGKKLLDPACGSGTFLVEALRRYLKASEQLVEEKGWSGILKELCNEYCIAGFDIHPFATFMAQMQFMLVLIPAYKKAIEEEDPKFVLNRLPIFRTDSLVDETKGKAMKVTIESFESGIRYILIDTCLPVEGGNLKIKMPYFKDIIAKTDLPNVEEYFAALQAVFDTVKESARQEKYEVDKEELERNFKRYLEDREWNGLVSFFTPYAEHFLLKFKELKETFGNGKLITSVEDLMLAAILKNYVKYDFVVGNPPYVRVQMLDKKQKEEYKKLYESAMGKFDIYTLFIERGISWLTDGGKIGYIVSNQFMVTNYGEKIRRIIVDKTKINQLVDFGDSRVFADVTNYPAILVSEAIRNSRNIKNHNIKVVKAYWPKENILREIESLLTEHLFYTKQFEIFEYPQLKLKDKTWDLLAPKEKSVFDKIEKRGVKLKEITDRIFQGINTGNDGVFFVLTLGDGDDKQLKIRRIKKEGTYNIEKKILKPLLKGENVRRCRIDWSGLYAVYPHKKGKRMGRSEAIAIPEEEMKKDYPNSYNYFKLFEYELKQRKYLMDSIEKGKRDAWYEIWNPRLHERFEKLKILTPNMSNRNNFTLDEVGYYFTRPVYGIILRDQYDNKKMYLYVLGILNSDVLEFYFMHIATIKAGNYFEYRAQYLARLPIHLPQTPEEQDLADEITKKVKQILEQVKLQQQIENFPNEYIQEYRSRGDEFNSVNISFNSNHKTIEPVVERNVDGRGYNIVIGKKEKSFFVESKVKANYVVAALKGKNAKKDEKKQILIPKRDTIVEEILKKFEEDNAKTISPSVAELEEEINELVYKLYGLNEKDVKVIDDFLRRF